jgi:hypothetical protein
MKQKPTSHCSCEVAYCADLHVNTILASLLRMKKGPQHTIMVEGSHTMTGKHRTYRMFQLKEKVRRMRLPYNLYFYHRGPGLVCYWDFRDPAKQAQKEWFDRNAEQGVYPDVSGMKQVK